MMRARLGVLCVSLLASVPLACGGDDEGGSDGDSGTMDSGAGGSDGGSGGSDEETGGTTGSGGNATGGSGTGGSGTGGSGDVDAGPDGEAGDGGVPDGAAPEAGGPDGGDGGTPDAADGGEPNNIGFFFECALGEAAVELAGTGLPLPIPDNGDVLTRSVTVPNIGTVQSAFVRVGAITHTFVGDLELSLTSPAGVGVDLSLNNGSSGDGYTATVFDDSCQTIVGESAPFTGCFAPQDPLDVVNGGPSEGVWALTVYDEFSQDTGTLDSWSLGLCVSPFFTCEAGQTAVVVANNTSQPIPDTGMIESMVSVVPSGTVQSVALRIGSLTHTWDEDLEIQLESPAGTIVGLTSDNGGGGDNYIGTVFEDACATAIPAGSAPFAGCFSPESPLSGFDGEDSDGTWTLTVSDDAGNDVGDLNRWRLGLCIE